MNQFFENLEDIYVQLLFAMLHAKFEKEWIRSTTTGARKDTKPSSISFLRPVTTKIYIAKCL